MNYRSVQWVCPHCQYSQEDLIDSTETACTKCGARFSLIIANNQSLDHIIDRNTNQAYGPNGAKRLIWRIQ